MPIRSASGGCVLNQLEPPFPKTSPALADLAGVGVADPRALGQAADLLQRSGNALGQARELHRRGVGQKFPLARYRALDEPAEKEAHAANRDQPQPEKQDRAGAPFPVRSGMAAAAKNVVPDDGQQQNPVKNANQAEVDPHVAVQDVAEFVGHHALELIAVEVVEGAGDADHASPGRCPAANALMLDSRWRT